MTTRAAANLVRSLRIGDGRSAIVDSPTVAGRGFKVACSGRRIFESDRTRGARVETQVGTFCLRVLFLHQRAFSEATSLQQSGVPCDCSAHCFEFRGDASGKNHCSAYLHHSGGLPAIPSVHHPCVSHPNELPFATVSKSSSGLPNCAVPSAGDVRLPVRA
jgi:hypothetical protein